MVRRCVAVAHSGGRDSTALLHATLQQAAGAGLRVAALHVHHGLMPQADDWQRHIQRQCARWMAKGAALELHIRRLIGQPLRGESTEAWARRERYAALADMAAQAGADLVLLAHHRRDQAETFLLQALRGSGPAGLSAMPRQKMQAGLQWARPWIEQPRQAIEAYVRRHRLRFVDDPSNDDPRFARNRLRLAVWPALTDAFGDAEQALSAAASRAQEAAACLQELAEQDLSALADGEALSLTAWAALSAARRANVLREWHRRCTGRGAAQALIARWLLELTLPSAPRRWNVADGEFRVYRKLLQWHPASRPHAVLADIPAPRLWHCSAPGVYHWPEWGGAMHVEATRERGLPVGCLSEGLQLSVRRGAERFQLAPASLPRGLKKQYQARGIPAWLRAGPLLYSGEQLVFVPGLGVDARAWAPVGRPQLALRWVAD
jgi:tRNA(Ile)-lysidine synthase